MSGQLSVSSGSPITMMVLIKEVKKEGLILGKMRDKQVISPRQRAEEGGWKNVQLVQTGYLLKTSEN